MSSVDTYRGQQGLTGQVPTSGYDPDPQVVDWIKQAASATGADPVVLMATALQESGGKLHGPAGDGGTSFSTFQFHIGGALGKHPPSWAATYPAFLNRAQEFARYHVRGGVGAAAVQRPQDPKLYAQGVDSLMAIAHRILQGSSGVPGSTRLPGTPAVGATGLQATPAFDFQAKSGPQAALDILNAKTPGEARLRFADSQRVFHMPAQNPLAGRLSPPAGMGGSGTSPVNGKFNLIGLPYQGTHTLYGNWESDNAIDIQVPVHTPVYATTDGTIGSQFGHINTGDAHMAGQRLHLNGKGGHFYYQHLAQVVVAPGEHVKAGQLLGYSGALNHIHFAVQNGDPRTYYKP